MSNGPSYVSPTSSSPRTVLVNVSLGEPGDHHPLAVLAQPVLLLGMHRGRDVRGQRPRRRRPDHERLALGVPQREPHVERRVGTLLVHAGLRELVLRERRAAPGAPLGRAVTDVDPPPLVHQLQEAPDVLDVRVAERVVVRTPVHPLTEALRALRQLGRRPHDLLATPTRELGEAELLDLPLRVEPELAFDPDLDPEALAVESVLVALVVAPERLVALEHVLQRPSPRRMHREGLVRGHGPVHEAELRAAGVLLAEPAERLFAVPPLQHVSLERVMIGLVRQGCEHASDSREGFFRV